MKKYIVLLLSVFLITGCSNNNISKDSISYNLDISSVYKEKIGISLPKNAYDIAEKYSQEKGQYVSKEYTLLNEDTYPYTSSSKEKYKKKIENKKNQVNVWLSYNYAEKNFLNQTYIYNCFEDYDLVSAEDYFEINLSGEFYCIKEFNRVDINVNTSFKVVDSNGMKTKNGYKWVINTDNYKDTSIYYKVARNYDNMPTEISNDSLLVILFKFLKLLIIISMFIVLFYLYKRFNNDKELY